MEPVERIFSDGTSVHLAAGVAALPREEGGYDVHVQGLHFVMDFDEEEVGVWYRPSGHFQIVDNAQKLMPDASGVIGQMNGQPVFFRGEALSVQGRDGVMEPTLTIRTPCAQVVLKSVAEQIAR